MNFVINQAEAIRAKICEALNCIGLSTLDEPCESHICQGLDDQGVVIARYVDFGPHIEFELRLAQKGVGCNLVSAILMWDAGDFWVTSDVRPELNGRTRVMCGDEPLLERTLHYIRNLDRLSIRSLH